MPSPIPALLQAGCYTGAPGGTWDGAVTMGRLGRVVAERGWLPWETRLASARTGQRNQQVPARRLDSIQMAFFYWRNKCSIKKIK